MPVETERREPDKSIFHITTAALWAEAGTAGFYEAPSLQSEGFIHCSTREQLPGVADRYFRGQRGLVLLTIRPEGLQAELRWEPATDGDFFPHIYGSIELDAVVQAQAVSRNAQGELQIP